MTTTSSVETTLLETRTVSVIEITTTETQVTVTTITQPPEVETATTTTDISDQPTTDVVTTDTTTTTTVDTSETDVIIEISTTSEATTITVDAPGQPIVETVVTEITTTTVDPTDITSASYISEAPTTVTDTGDTSPTDSSDLPTTLTDDIVSPTIATAEFIRTATAAFWPSFLPAPAQSGAPVPLSCPRDNLKGYKSGDRLYIILCDRKARGHGLTVGSRESFADCVDWCNSRRNCAGVSWVPTWRNCRFKKRININTLSPDPRGKVVHTAIQRAVVCPFSNTAEYRDLTVYCNTDAPGNDLPTPQLSLPGFNRNTYVLSALDFQDCIDQCIERPDDCVGASWVPYRKDDNCYLKSKIANFRSTVGQPLEVHTAVFRYRIHSVVYADKNVPKQIVNQLTVGPGFVINTDTLTDMLGDPWPGNRKTISVLMSRFSPKGETYLSFVAVERSGTITVMPERFSSPSNGVTVLGSRNDPVNDWVGNIVPEVIGATWGREGIVIPPKDVFFDTLRYNIRSRISFTLSNAIFRRDTWPNVPKSGVIWIFPVRNLRTAESIKAIAGKEGAVVSSQHAMEEFLRGDY